MSFSVDLGLDSFISGIPSFLSLSNVASANFFS